MDTAETRELRLLQSRNHAKDPKLLAILQLGLEADHVEQRRQRIVLTKLDHGVSFPVGSRIEQPNRLHRSVAQGLAPALRHHLDRQTAFEIGRVLLPFAELGLLPSRSEERRVGKA